MKILDGKELSNKISLKLKDKFAALSSVPKFIIFQVGDNVASNTYINFKLKKAKELGVEAQVIRLEETITQDDLIIHIEKEIESVDAAIVQLPLPKHIDKQTILNSIPHKMDIDGLSVNNKIVTPATPRGIMLLMKEYDIEVSGKTVGVIGKSNLVGKPVAYLCEQAGAIVSTFDKKTGINGSEEHDILIVAAGQLNLVNKNHIKPNSVVIDVGINEIADEYAMKPGITGDVDRASVGTIPSAMSPVPGGVGPMTVISLFLNLYDVVK